MTVLAAPGAETDRKVESVHKHWFFPLTLSTSFLRQFEGQPEAEVSS